MISPQLRIDHIDPAAWRHAFRLLTPPSRAPGAKRPGQPPLLLFVEEGVCVKAIRPGIGRVDPAVFRWAGAWSLGRIRREAGAPLAIAVEGDALERIAGAIDSRIRAGDDYVAQLLEAARALRAEVGKGVHIDPDLLSVVPIPSYAALQKTWNMLLPDDRSAGLFVFDRGELWTSYLVEKRAGELSRITTHAALGVARPDMRRHKELLEAMESRLARPHAAIFATLDAWREIIGPDAGALARQVALRGAIIDPAPPWVIALTGAGAMAGVAQGASRLFGRFVPQAVKDTARSMSPFAALGFDPIDLFTKIRKSV
ncbi:MAG: hypothetical protein EXR72_24440 [Myxococcales bacterium]|nr:hypothetical protein [Myxococcales bacterium]